MSRTQRKPYPKTGKMVGRGECPEWFRVRQEKGLIQNGFYDKETKEEIWKPSIKKSLKRKRAKKERKKIKDKLRNY